MIRSTIKVLRSKIKILDKVVFNRNQLIDVIRIYFMDKRLGVDHLNKVPVEKLGIPLDKMPVHYECSANSYLLRLFNTLNITSKDSIIDLGCGKCGALLYLRKFPFNNLVGIEYSKPLFEQGRENIEKIKDRRVKIKYDDAGKYSELDQFNFIYMFNPFGIYTMSKVLSNIKKSYEYRPRKITLIYLNPVLHDEVLMTGIFNKIKEQKSAFKYKFFVYETSI